MLNNEQKEAVEYNRGPLLIIAGAGTGKTTVIVEKIKSFLKKKLAKPEEILALTFTEKAAFEMEERVDKEIPYGYFQMWISTFHAFADQVLKEQATHIGLTPGFRLMTEAETIIFLRKNLFLFNLNYFRPLGNPNKFLGALLDHFSRLRDEDTTPEQYLKWVKKQKNSEETKKYLELADAYKTYQAIKIKEGLFDFSDLIYYLLKLFRERKNILQDYQKKFKYILVDEFQDTNIAQYQLIKLICPQEKNPKLTVVGDDSQAIYKFRGASVSNIMSFMKDYKKAKQITLNQNYRSNQNILDKSYQLIKFNDPDTLEAKLGISKRLISQKSGKSDSVGFFMGERVEEEADFVVKQILTLKKKYQYSDFAILCRANNHSDPFIRAFSRAELPYQFLGPGMLLKQPEIKDLIAYLKVLYNVEDSVSLFRVLSMDVFDIDPKDLAYLASFAKKANLFLFQALEIYLSFFENELHKEEFSVYEKILPLLSEIARNKLFFIYRLIKKHFGLVKKETAGQILYFFLEETKYLNKLIAYKTEKEEKIALNVSKFFNRIKVFESEHEDSSVAAVVDFLDMSLELGESPIVSQTDISSYNAINILTVHSAKGLEFPVVFLVNLTRGRFPTYERRETIPISTDLIKEILPEGDSHAEEERRLFYVGLTRAKDEVFLTASRFYGEGIRQQKLSPFVEETLGKKFLAKYEMVTSDEKKQMSIFDYKKPKEKILKPIINNSVFSYTQLETYERCPLQYKYQYVLRIPTAPTAALSFGNTIHRTLQNFYEKFSKNSSVGKDDLLNLYKKNWNPVGYISAAHEVRMKKEGESILKNFFGKFHSQNIRIVDVEKPFKIRINQNTSIVGKIDRVDKLDNDQIEIIDYKTGKMPSEKGLKKNLQLAIYALAVSDRGLYGKKLNKIKLSFFYLQDMKKISSTKTENDIDTVKKEVVEKAEEIRTNRFEANVGPWCDFCPFRMICEAWQ
ncbi:ATP-dependent helicase [Patescibacteria group bacterium]|nr:ATP-dependent helicase [Patescibacteria group bacterium]